MALTQAQMPGKIVIPAQAGIQKVRDLHDLDSGSSLHSARNDGGFGLSMCHWGIYDFLVLKNIVADIGRRKHANCSGIKVVHTLCGLLATGQIFCP